jgi:Xaa-Pro dipeptidase
MTSRREFLQAAAVVGVSSPMLRALASGSHAVAAPAVKLEPMTRGAVPISAAERRTRISRAQSLLRERHLSALLMESGSSLEYFTGIRWRRSERVTAAVIPADGELLVVTPAFEEPSIREMLQVKGDVLPWDEHENPFEKMMQGLRDRGIASGPLAAESTTRFFIVAGLRQAAPGIEIIPADPIVRACRLVKSPAELALMQLANDVTLAALKFVHGQVKVGMNSDVLSSLMDKTTLALGGNPEFSLVLLNEASAFPHGSLKPQSIRQGSVILMDCGCSVLGYQSDISRTWVFGAPNPRQRKVWDTVKRGQEIALETAKTGVAVGSIDDAVRRFYEGVGWGPGYKLPGLSHRTGHGIGLDGHESPYLVHGDATPLAAGMCFSDEPGIYIPGEFGVRLEDCWFMTENGPQTFTRLARSLDEPI